MTTVANPRLIDVFGLDIKQENVDFAIPRLEEDIPLCVDPFLLWSSAKAQYRAMHGHLLEFFDLVRTHIADGDASAAALLLSGLSEPREVGLGYAAGSKCGSNVGAQLIADILSAFHSVPQIASGGLRHFEELQLVVPGIAEDRVSDTAVCILRTYFIEYTQKVVEQLGIPSRTSYLGNVFDFTKKTWVAAPAAQLPYNPRNNSPILLVPLDLLRHLPWINYDDYYRSAYAPRVLPPNRQRERVAKSAVLKFNARHYTEVERYVREKELVGVRCKPDPLFRPLSLATLKTKYQKLRALPMGLANRADREYEDLISILLPTLFYPVLEFAQSRVRTISGAHIRDLIFYNDGKNPFWKDVRGQYDGRQPVFELKNVRSLDPDHVDQLYRYLDSDFGRFGVLVSRNPAPVAVMRNTVDLHSSKRVMVLCLNDRDIELMLSLAESRRDPTEAIKKKYVEFTRNLPK